MNLTKDELNTILDAIGCLMEYQCDSVDHTELIDKLKRELRQ